MTGVLMKRGHLKTATDTHTRRTPGEHEGRDWGSATLSQGTAAFASDHQTVGARHRTDSPSQPQEGPTL